MGLIMKTFSLVVDIRAIRILITITVFYDYEIWQMDVKIAFLNGYLDEDIYMVQPEGFVDPKHPEKYVSFKDPFMILSKHQEAGIKDLIRKSKSLDLHLDEPCVYQKASGSNVIFLILFVDDIIIMGNHIPSLELGRYGVSRDLDTAYRGFLGVGTTVLDLVPSWSSVECRHRYVVSSLMNTAYWYVRISYVTEDKNKKIRSRRIMGLAAACPAGLWRYWPR
ncbi:retrotransposon protein, putative, ty1-copia subclass [Tanacetum coccineum]|uniref:Retrotransposon protein, putative, ty1-copia subclass n=1 Tax=Tanacetum coccineum TaxID=301880 RepID=A0ABQ5HMZ1_9ASTR